jgi:hypothetical protein
VCEGVFTAFNDGVRAIDAPSDDVALKVAASVESNN